MNTPRVLVVLPWCLFAALAQGPAPALAQGPAPAPARALDNTSALSAPSGSFTTGTGSPWRFQGNPIIAITGDFNGDGKADFAVGDNVTGSIWIMLGDGAGSFSASPIGPVSVGAGSFLMAAADFNRDGQIDLAVVLIPPAGRPSVSLFLNNGDAGFKTSFTRSIALFHPGAILATDLNGDGNPDLAIGDFSDLVVLIGDGAGGLSLGTGGGSAFRLLYAPTSIVPGDFNGDGNLDLAVCNYDDSLAILRGDGSGGFSPASGSPYPVGGYPAAVTAGDFNRDGKLDLAVASSSSRPVHILMGDGTGGFNEATFSPISTRIHDIVSADFDGDGILDLALIGDDMGVNIALGAGDGTFHLTDFFKLGYQHFERARRRFQPGWPARPRCC